MLRWVLRRFGRRSGQSGIWIGGCHQSFQCSHLQFYNRRITSSSIISCNNGDIKEIKAVNGSTSPIISSCYSCLLLFSNIGLVERDIASLAAVGDIDNIVRRLPNLSSADMDKTIIKTIEIMENNGLYESISRYIIVLHSLTHLFTSFL